MRRLLGAVFLAALALVLIPKLATGSASSTTAAVIAPAGSDYGTSQLQALWVQAGGSQGTKVNAACHAMQESSGNPDVTSPNPDGGINVGEFQLDTRGKGAGYSVAQLQDPLTNARVTVAATRDGTDWTAWATPGC
jgi:soluble lytic murein transglycosylase-like protein